MYVKYSWLRSDSDHIQAEKLLANVQLILLRTQMPLLHASLHTILLVSVRLYQHRRIALHTEDSFEDNANFKHFASSDREQKPRNLVSKELKLTSL